MTLVDWPDIEGDVLLLSESERIPNQRRKEQERMGIGNDGDVVVIANQFL